MNFLPTANYTKILLPLWLLVLWVTHVHGGKPLPPTSPVDPSLFKQAYGVLGSERLMYPVDMADWPLKITSERQLLVDDFLLASSSGLTREMHQPKPHSNNPVLRLWEHPWERWDGHSVFVLRDERTGLFRMWYNTRNHIIGADGVPYRGPTCYAYSKDGMHWIKPKLGIVGTDGGPPDGSGVIQHGTNRDNNITLAQGTIDGLFYEPHDPDPSRRYKALVWHDPGVPSRVPKYAPREGFYLYWSPDGLHWQGDNRRCIVPNGMSRTFPKDMCDGVGDTTNFRWDRKLGKYVANTKILFYSPVARMIGQSESDDLIHWTRPRMTMHRDSLDGNVNKQLGELTTFPYESMWIALLGVYQFPKDQWKQKIPELAASRDGRHWYRIGDRKPFIPLGGEDSWNADFTIAGRPGPLLVGDQLWFYYWGSRRHERLLKDGINTRDQMHIGLAKLRRDGFISLNAGQQTGTMITRPLSFSGKKLFVNAEIAHGGSIKAAILSPTTNEPIPNHSLSDALAVTEGAVKIPVTWAKAADIQLAAGDHARLQLELKNAKLYSFWIK